MIRLWPTQWYFVWAIERVFPTPRRLWFWRPGPEQTCWHD